MLVFNQFQTFEIQSLRLCLKLLSYSQLVIVLNHQQTYVYQNLMH